MRVLAVSLLAVTPLLAVFGPSVRVDQETRPTYACYHADVALGPSLGGLPPVYVAFENDSVPFLIERSDIAFQRSTDLGRTWLAQDVLIRRGSRFACYPDVKVARDGTVHLLYTDRIDGSQGHIHSVRSTDGGLTWSSPVQVDDNSSRVAIGWARLALDSADNLFCAWTDKRGPYLRVYSDVSTDAGRTWGTDVRVDDDTVSFNCYPPDVYVQPGSNDYLVVAVAPVRYPSGIVLHSHFYRSTDAGRTFTPGFQLDTFDGYCQQPHVVADEGYVITDYSGNGYVNQCMTLARTWFESGDSWGPQVEVTGLDTTHSAYTNGNKLAIDPSGAVHTALMVCTRSSFVYDVFYARSDDHGLTWSERELVNDSTPVDQWDPNIATDSAGCAYVVWQDMRGPKAQIWFGTNAWTGIAASVPACPRRLSVSPTLFRHRAELTLTGLLGTDNAVSVFDAAGRLVRILAFPHGQPLSARCSVAWDGTFGDGRRCPPGVYHLRCGAAAARVILLQ